nr:MAG TPA: hypothetical protein [Caudoviricetes sp.]
MICTHFLGQTIRKTRTTVRVYFGGAYDTLYEPLLHRKFILSATFNYTILKK